MTSFQTTIQNQTVTIPYNARKSTVVKLLSEVHNLDPSLATKVRYRMTQKKKKKKRIYMKNYMFVRRTCSSENG